METEQFIKYLLIIFVIKFSSVFPTMQLTTSLRLFIFENSQIISLLFPDKKKNDSEELKSIDGHPIWYVKGQNQSSLTTSQDGQFPSQNEGRIKFEKTKIPVIFVLGMYKTEWSLFTPSNIFNLPSSLKFFKLCTVFCKTT